MDSFFVAILIGIGGFCLGLVVGADGVSGAFQKDCDVVGLVRIDDMAYECRPKAGG